MPRIRLQSCEPLPALKAWFLIPSNVASIRDLKLTLCSQISILKEVHLQPSQLALEMDDFEILNESPVDLVREADVITLRKREVVPEVVQTLKRKVDTEDTLLVDAKRRKHFTGDTSSSSISSQTTSSTTGSDTSTSSSSSSDDESSSSDSAPSVKPITRMQPLAKAITSDVINRHSRLSVTSTRTQQSTVPPGFGKPSTKARNQRRKIKRKFLAAAGNAIPGSPSTSTPIAPHNHQDENMTVRPCDDPAPECASMPSAAIAPNSTLSSLGNRNKRKGFKKSMESAVPQKIVFDSTRSLSFVPPSERDSLPHNIFVTCADVEWRTGKGRRRDTEVMEGELVSERKGAQPTNELHESADWSAVETRWSEYPRIEAGKPVPLGSTVAWRGFGLDPLTLTPQASLLHLGRVVALETDTLTVTPLARPGIGPATFGRAQISENEDDSMQQISTPLPEIWSSDWRLVSDQ